MDDDGKGSGLKITQSFLQDVRGGNSFSESKVAEKSETDVEYNEGIEALDLPIGRAYFRR